MMEEIYRQFLNKTATGRKMELAKLEPLAGGRVWTGRQAQQVGLVDQVGTMRDAIAEAKKLAGQDPDVKLELLILPRAKSLLDQIVEGDIGANSGLTSQLPSLAGRASQQLAAWEQLQRLFREPTMLWMPHRFRYE
jgi:protease-4